MKTLYEVLKENPGNTRTNILLNINKLIKQHLGPDMNTCTLSLITNVFNPIAPPLGAMLTPQVMQLAEQALIKFRAEGCNDLYVILSTFGGDIHFPELFMSKARGLGFERVNIIIPSIAMSAGTLLTMLTDRVIGFSSTSIGPVDPQFILSTPQGPRIVSTIAFKRLIEETLPKLANERGLGPDGLSKLYVAQDLYLYQESLRSIDYVRHVLSTNLKEKTHEKQEELLNTFLTDVETHGKPFGLQKLEELGFTVIFLDKEERYKELSDAIIEYYARVEHAFVFELSRGIRLILIGTPFGEIIQEALTAPQTPQAGAAPSTTQPIQQPKS